MKDQIASDDAVFYNSEEFAEAATYNGVEISVVEADMSAESSGIPGFVQPTFFIRVKAADVPYPVGGDSVTFRNISCIVGQYVQSSGRDWLLSLERDSLQV